MKNYPFHAKKVRIQESPQLDNDQLRDKTIIALNRLGEQSFSPDSGGYSLENWARGVNMLLDDFERNVGEGKLSSEYISKRRELSELVSRPVATGSMDEKIAGARREIEAIEKKVDAERARIAGIIADLKAEQARCSEELELDRQANLVSPQPRSGSFLGRLFGNGPKAQPTDTTRIDELESRLQAIPIEISEQKALLKSMEGGSQGSKAAEEREQLAALRSRLGELESERSASLQLVKERKEITASIAGAIAAMSP